MVLLVVLLDFITGSILGNKIGEKFYENITSKIYNTIQFFSGNLGMFKTGGVEFSFPKQIPGFKIYLLFNTHILLLLNMRILI